MSCIVKAGEKQYLTSLGLSAFKPDPDACLTSPILTCALDQLMNYYPMLCNQQSLLSLFGWVAGNDLTLPE